MAGLIKRYGVCYVQFRSAHPTPPDATPALNYRGIPNDRGGLLPI
jgi:hypothetical protein